MLPSRIRFESQSLVLVINLFVSYSTLLLIFTAALLLFALILLVRRRNRTPPSQFQEILAKPRIPEDQLKYLVPLLVYEESYPRFCEIVSLVLEHFPLERFLRGKEFRTALVFLQNSAFSESSRQSVTTAMSALVSSFLSDPDVEYRCRSQLQRLVDLFLQEIESS